MKPTPLVLDYIKRCFTYNPDTGIVFRKGKPTGTLRPRGYVMLNIVLDIRYEGCILSLQVYAHQVAWYLTYGEWAEMIIDHIDRDGGNNRLNNLRLATCAQNIHNQSKMNTRKTTSQYKGVSLVGRKYRAQLHYQDKHIHLGYYHTEAEAALAYNAKASELLGVFACLNTVPAI